MGHEEGLTEVYRKYSEKDMLKMYGEGEHALLLFGEMSGDAQQLRQEVNQVYRENFEMRGVFDSLRSENNALKEQLKRLDEKFSGLEKLVKDLREAAN